jgi:hypothetical protein
VALADLALPGMSGAEPTRTLLKDDPDIRITPNRARRSFDRHMSDPIRGGGRR